MSKESIYDEQIHPLMAEIIAICKQNNIAMFFSAHIPNDEDEHLACTTHLPGDNGEIYPPFSKCFSAVRPGSAPVLHTKTIDSQGNVTLSAYL